MKLLAKVTDLLIGINLDKYRNRARFSDTVSCLQMLALEIHVREELAKRGIDPFSVDVQASFMDHVDMTLSYAENKAIMGELLSGRRER